MRAAAAAVEEQKRAPEAAPAKADTPDLLSDQGLDNKLKGRLTEYFSVKDNAVALEDIQVILCDDIHYRWEALLFIH